MLVDAVVVVNDGPKAALKAVVTSVLYRITDHGIGRLRNVGAPVPPFAPNYPPCLQSATIPDPSTPLPTADLLKYLPHIGTLGSLITFYYIFANNAPYVPLVPYKGPEDELFFDQSKYPAANQALINFRKGIASFISYFQPQVRQLLETLRDESPGAAEQARYMLAMLAKLAP